VAGTDYDNIKIINAFAGHDASNLVPVLRQSVDFVIDTIIPFTAQPEAPARQTSRCLRPGGKQDKGLGMKSAYRK
jgi:hypothetical protein